MVEAERRAVIPDGQERKWIVLERAVRSKTLVVRNDDPPIALLRVSIVFYHPMFLPSVCREEEAGWSIIIKATRYLLISK
jgi:hypothetical protein